ncbi:hypothetical protein JD844_017888 [Phrynosoma platyrhinos]|uniref:DUF5580 domain-containing protein n=1 Tax=Phrynosoma platyrhinos TaxID=52577 RepID=A0ABQ7SMG4_PHRPL|nr:hypothetical protein JD844_017888 [Phrynosoma platyrhinos]
MLTVFFILGRNKEKSEDDFQKGNKQHKDLAAKTWEQMNPEIADSNDFEEQEAWIDRFRKLEKALYLSDVKNTVHNYLQIEMICQKHGLPLYPGMLEALAITYDLSRSGKIL